MKNGQPFAFAGLWDEWHAADGSPVRTCTIITTSPNPLMANIHDRMPVILDEVQQRAWLDVAITDRDRLAPLLAPRRADDMELVVTSEQFVNHGVDDPRCIEPVA